jgi:ribonuclease Z
MNKALILLLGLLFVVGVGRELLSLPAVCGSASPLGMGQAQACIAVVTLEHNNFLV